MTASVAGMTAVQTRYPLPTLRQVLSDLPTFARILLRIQAKDGKIIPFAFNRVQQHYWQRRCQSRSRRHLILKARQIGFSTLTQAELFRDVTTGPARTLTLSHSDAATQMLRRIAQRFYLRWPAAIPKPGKRIDSAILATYPDFDSESHILTAGSPLSGRGGTFTKIHASEVAFWPDPWSILSGAMQAGNPILVLESTPNGAQGFFYEKCMAALDGDTDWELHFYPWWFEPDYRVPLDEGETLSYDEEETRLVQAHNLTPEQIKWRRSKQRELRHLFAQEYPEDPVSCFLLSGAGFFGNISHAWSAPPDATYQVGHRYIAGLDWGQADDFTVLSILDATRREQVALLRVNRLPWSEMRRQVGMWCRQWHVRLLLAEANSMGSTNIEALTAEFAAEGIDIPVQAFTTTHALKAALLGDLANALQDGTLRLLNIPEQRHEFEVFQATQTATGSWTYGAPRGAHDDTVIANMAAWAGVTGSIGRGDLLLSTAPPGLADYRG